MNIAVTICWIYIVVITLQKHARIYKCRLVQRFVLRSARLYFLTDENILGWHILSAFLAIDIVWTRAFISSFITWYCCFHNFICLLQTSIQVPINSAKFIAILNLRLLLLCNSLLYLVSLKHTVFCRDLLMRYSVLLLHP